MLARRRPSARRPAVAYLANVGASNVVMRMGTCPDGVQEIKTRTNHSGVAVDRKKAVVRRLLVQLRAHNVLDRKEDAVGAHKGQGRAILFHRIN